MNDSLKFDKESHTYYVDGTPVPSVTEIIRAGGSDTDYSGIPKWILERAGEIGDGVHEAVENFYTYGASIFAFDPSVNAYLEGFYSFLQDTSYSHRISERKLYCNCHWYAGTVDLIGYVDGELSVVDVKTTNKLNLEYVELQTAGYKHLAETFLGQEVMKRFALHLTKRSTYELVPCQTDTAWSDFESLVKQYHGIKDAK